MRPRTDLPLSLSMLIELVSRLTFERIALLKESIDFSVSRHRLALDTQTPSMSDGYLQTEMR